MLSGPRSRSDTRDNTTDNSFSSVAFKDPLAHISFDALIILTTLATATARSRWRTGTKPWEDRHEAVTFPTNEVRPRSAASESPAGRGRSGTKPWERRWRGLQRQLCVCVNMRLNANSPRTHPELTPNSSRTHPELTLNSPRTHPELTPDPPRTHPKLTPNSP